MEMIRLLVSALLISGQRCPNSLCQLNSVGVKWSHGISVGLVTMSLRFLNDVVIAQ